MRLVSGSFSGSSFGSTFSLISGLALFFVAGQASAADYKIDPSHSKVGFTVRHLMISKVHGDFKDFEGGFNFDAEKGVLKSANFVAKAASIETGDAKRDDHLRGPDFFDVKKFPTLTLTNNKITKTGKDTYKWDTDLTMHGVTKPVVFNLEMLGLTKDPWGMKRAGFTASSKINRKDFGLNWNKALEAGGVVVGEEVEIQLDAEAIEASASPAAGAPATSAATPAKKK